MLHYSPASEPDTERLLLIDFAHPQHGSEYGHLTARVIRRARPHQHKEGRTYYADGENATGYRHASWMSGKDKALFVEDFQVDAQFDLKTYRDADEAPEYGEVVEFNTQFMSRVRSEDAKHMVDTFTRLSRKLAKQEEIYGSVRGFAPLAIRVAVALGITKFAKYPNASKNGNRSLDQGLPTFGPAEVGSVARRLINDARVEYA